MDDLPLEALGAGELRREALVVAVVAGAAVEEVAGQLDRLAPVLGANGPQRLRTRPLGRDDPVAEADFVLDPVLARRLADVVADLLAGGDRVFVAPRLERVPERVHVRVRADAGIAEEVPGAADRLAGLEDRVAPTGAVPPQVGAGADAGEAGADDQDVDVLASLV